MSKDVLVLCAIPSDDLFIRSKPVIFACHDCPSLIHRPTYRRTNHANLQATRTANFARAIRGGHRRDIERHGGDTPEIRDGRWGARRAANSATP